MRGSAPLAAAALLAALVGGHEQPPSTFGCPNTLRALCNPIYPDYVARCKLCTGQNQHALRAAGCSAADVQLFCAAGWGDPSRPNIIFVLTDDMGWGDFSYNNVSQRFAFPGAGRSADDPFLPNAPRTPNIDAMARGSNTLLFHRFYAGSAVCSPTRASALTGRTSDGPQGRQSLTFSSYGEYGERALVNYADRPCRINTYGDSFTACGQTR